MTVTLLPVDDTNRETVLGLDVADHQRAWIATNARSLDQAAANDALVPLAIVAEGGIVGFLMFEPRAGNVALHRFMVDVRHQRQGLGRAAMQVLLERFAAEERGTVYLSFRPDNDPARTLYEGLGFTEHEIEPDGEVVLRLDPSPPHE